MAQSRVFWGNETEGLPSLPWVHGLFSDPEAQHLLSLKDGLNPVSLESIQAPKTQNISWREKGMCEELIITLANSKVYIYFGNPK